MIRKRLSRNKISSKEQQQQQEDKYVTVNFFSYYLFFYFVDQFYSPLDIQQCQEIFLFTLDEFYPEPPKINQAVFKAIKKSHLEEKDQRMQGQTGRDIIERI